MTPDIWFLQQLSVYNFSKKPFIRHNPHVLPAGFTLLNTEQDYYCPNIHNEVCKEAPSVSIGAKQQHAESQCQIDCLVHIFQHTDFSQSTDWTTFTHSHLCLMLHHIIFVTNLSNCLSSSCEWAFKKSVNLVLIFAYPGSGVIDLHPDPAMTLLILPPEPARRI